jgi:putative addiction module CopG family antidote
MLVQVLDEDSASPIGSASVTRRPKGAPTTDLKIRMTDGRGAANFGNLPPGEFEICACRKDHIPSLWKAWRELPESDEIQGAKVIALKLSEKTTEECVYVDQNQTRRFAPWESPVRRSLLTVPNRIRYCGKRRVLNMEVQLTDDQKAFVRQAIENGRYRSEEDALHEAMSLWEGRERRRAEILALVDQAEASLARGEGRRIATGEETAQLAADIKRRGLARLAAEENIR